MAITPIRYMIKYKENLKRRDYLIDLLTRCEHTPIGDPATHYVGQIVTVNGEAHGITSINETTVNTIKIDSGSPILAVYDLFELTPSDLPNVKSKCITSVGRFIFNYLLLVDPFGNKFDYINSTASVDSVESKIAQAGLKGTVTVQQIKKGYIANAYYLGHFTELCVPSFSAKSLVTGDNVLKRKAELLEEYKDRLTEPIVMAKIEEELIALDREYLKDDPSYGFYGVKSKNFDVCRKRMLLTGGMLEAFEKGGSGYKFSPDSLDEGWEPNLFPVYANDIRRGTFDRAVNTAKGGEQAEFLRRIFQDSYISESNCNTTKGMKTVLSEDIMHKYIHRSIITPRGIVVLTEDNIFQYKNKTVLLRSPKYCETKIGYCYTCMGELMRRRGVRSLTMGTAKIGSVYLSSSMKSMHGKKTQILDLSDVDSFVIK